jgi:hypothetical protein
LSEMNKNSAGGARRAWPLLVGLPLILAVGVAAVLLSGERHHSAGQERPSGGGEQASQDHAAQDHAGLGHPPLGHPSLGDAGAPVVMIEYGDFQ